MIFHGEEKFSGVLKNDDSADFLVYSTLDEQNNLIYIFKDSLLEGNYEFRFDLRTIDDTDNWVFSLDNFSSLVEIKNRLHPLEANMLEIFIPIPPVAPVITQFLCNFSFSKMLTVFQYYQKTQILENC